jgi:hypothetical protein
VLLAAQVMTFVDESKPVYIKVLDIPAARELFWCKTSDADSEICYERRYEPDKPPD